MKLSEIKLALDVIKNWTWLIAAVIVLLCIYPFIAEKDCDEDF